MISYENPLFLFCMKSCFFSDFISPIFLPFRSTLWAVWIRSSPWTCPGQRLPSSQEPAHSPCSGAGVLPAHPYAIPPFKPPSSRFQSAASSTGPRKLHGASRVYPSRSG